MPAIWVTERASSETWAAINSSASAAASWRSGQRLDLLDRLYEDFHHGLPYHTMPSHTVFRRRRRYRDLVQYILRATNYHYCQVAPFSLVHLYF